METLGNRSLERRKERSVQGQGGMGEGMTGCALGKAAAQ